MTAARARRPKFAICKPITVDENLQFEAARIAIRENPANAPLLNPAAAPMKPQHLALVTSRWWGAKGVDLSVSFLETTPTELRDRILSHMNAWGDFCQVKFRWSQSGGQVRISRGRGGYWSYVGTDVLAQAASMPTMNLEALTMQTSESEYVRVVRHETGHTLGFPHEQQRPEIVALLDANKTIAYFGKTQGWSAQMVKQQILTPLSAGDLQATPLADQLSIMCYQFPGACTKSGKAIPGGLDFSADDKGFAAQMYPKQGVPPIEPPTNSAWKYVFTVDKVTGKVIDAQLA